MTDILFRRYCSADSTVCIGIFDANCPAYFAPNERRDYAEFLDEVPHDYEVCEVDGRVLGAFGLMVDDNNEKRLSWIMLDPRSQGLGIGMKIMERVIQLGRESDTRAVRIAASHKSATFFAKFGATTTTSTRNGWGPGMHRIDMILPL
jgi:GNAT superfamily N-acetyltransferase